ncbi:hypothetical protein J4401_03900 [Candidatus Woesearchaeota archaeon]|nr:hypothetical protein [Candidatus Woesearchaeota archaeon]
MSLENDVFGIRYAVPLLLVVIPVVSALVEYQSKQKRISMAWHSLLRN